jgi:hypothetical protein
MHFTSHSQSYVQFHDFIYCATPTALFQSNSSEDFESQLLTLAFLNVITRIKTNGNSHNGYGSDQMP